MDMDLRNREPVTRSRKSKLVLIQAIRIISRCYQDVIKITSPITPKTVKQLNKKITIPYLQNRYKNNEPITVLTACDYPSGLFVEKAGIEICLVGDSLGMVALGHENINPTTVEEMLHHCRAVARGAKSPFLIGDMPFGSYEISPTDALKNAIRFLKEGNME
ncbi:4897_t:CDS:2, partial [Diversispora eburnea]